MQTVSLRILLVDSDPLMLRAVARELRGHSLRFANDIPSALEELQREVPDIVLTDWELAGGDGIELLEIIRHASPQVGRALVSSSSPPYINELLLVGMIQYFSLRPFSTPLREAIVELARRTSHRHRQLTREVQRKRIASTYEVN